MRLYFSLRSTKVRIRGAASTCRIMRNDDCFFITMPLVGLVSESASPDPAKKDPKTQQVYLTDPKVLAWLRQRTAAVAQSLIVIEAKVAELPGKDCVRLAEEFVEYVSREFGQWYWARTDGSMTD